MTDEVDSDQSDFNGGTSRGTKFHLELWLPIFFTMEVLVMLVSFALNVMLLRAVAKNRLKETPVYMFIMWLFFTKLVDDAVIIGQFIKYQQPNYSHTTTLCQVWLLTHFFCLLFVKNNYLPGGQINDPSSGGDMFSSVTTSNSHISFSDF